MSSKLAVNPTKVENSRAFGGLDIVRMAPEIKVFTLILSINNRGEGRSKKKQI